MKLKTFFFEFEMNDERLLITIFVTLVAVSAMFGMYMHYTHPVYTKMIQSSKPFLDER